MLLSWPFNIFAFVILIRIFDLEGTLEKVTSVQSMLKLVISSAVPLMSLPALGIAQLIFGQL